MFRATVKSDEVPKVSDGRANDCGTSLSAVASSLDVPRVVSTLSTMSNMTKMVQEHGMTINKLKYTRELMSLIDFQPFFCVGLQIRYLNH
jgi:hypothetical protein